MVMAGVDKLASGNPQRAGEPDVACERLEAAIDAADAGLPMARGIRLGAVRNLLPAAIARRDRLAAMASAAGRDDVEASGRLKRCADAVLRAERALGVAPEPVVTPAPKAAAQPAAPRQSSAEIRAWLERAWDWLERNSTHPKFGRNEDRWIERLREYEEACRMEQMEQAS